MTGVASALAVLSSLAYGAADFLGGLATKRGSTVFSAVVWSQATGLVLVLLLLPFFPRASPTAADLGWGAATGLAGGVGLAFLYRGLAVGVMSVVAPVTAGAPAVGRSERTSHQFDVATMPAPSRMPRRPPIEVSTTASTRN